MRVIKLLFEDWLRSPISGTVAVFFMGVAASRALHGDISGFEHAAIICLVVSNGRNKVK